MIFGLAWLASHATVDDLLLRWRQGFWVAPLGLGYSIALRLGLGIIGLSLGWERRNAKESHQDDNG